MNLKKLIGKEAIWREGREAKLIVIKDAFQEDEYVTFVIRPADKISHYRSWSSGEDYLPLGDEDPETILRHAADSITIRDDFVQGRMGGWQLFIDKRLAKKFRKKDDRWCAECF